MLRKLPAFSDPKAKKILKELCDRRGIQPSLVRHLTEKWAGHSGRGRAHGVTGEIDFIVSDYLRDHEEDEG